MEVELIWTQISCISVRRFTIWAIRKPHKLICNTVLISAVKQSYSSYMYIYMHTYIHLFNILFHYGLFQDIAGSSLGYTVGHCCLSILHMSVYKCFVFNIHKNQWGTTVIKFYILGIWSLDCLDNVLTVTQIKD